MSEEEKDKGFSYSSPSVQRKRAAKLLVIELGALVVLVIGILFALVYLNVIPLGSFMQNLGGRSAEQEGKPDDSYTNKNGHTIEVKSEIPGYKVELKNEEKLLALLEEWKVFDREYEAGWGIVGSTREKLVKRLNISVTNKPLRSFKAISSETGVVYLSAEADVKPDVFNIRIQIGDLILNDSEKRSELGQYANSTLFFSLFQMINPTLEQVEAFQILDKVNNFIRNDPRAKVEYFVIKKQ